MNITKEEIIKLVEQVFDNNIYSIGENTILGIKTSVEGKLSFLSELDELLSERQTSTEVSENHNSKALGIADVGSSVLLPKGFKIYKCTDCQEINIKKDNRQITVGYCDNCGHPLWNDDVD